MINRHSRLFGALICLILSTNSTVTNLSIIMINYNDNNRATSLFTGIHYSRLNAWLEIVDTKRQRLTFRGT